MSDAAAFYRPGDPCDLCGGEVVLMKDTSTIYRGTNFGPAYVCQGKGCGARIGCHSNSKTFAPKGRLADAALRQAKIDAHAAFDPLWRRKVQRERISKSKARRLAYRWLGDQLGIDANSAHIGAFDAVTCRRVVEICAPFLRGGR